MKLWLDADATPREVKEICFRASERLSLETVLVANQRIQLPVGYLHLSAVRVDGGPDVADLYIAEHAVGAMLRSLLTFRSRLYSCRKVWS